MEFNPTSKIKEIVTLYLNKIKTERFRFNLLFKLNDRTYFLFNIFESKKGFLPYYKGLQLIATKSFLEAMKKSDEIEISGEIVTDHPFLYGDYLKDSTLYMKKIYVYAYDIGVFEFAIKKDSIEPQIKRLLNEMIEKIMPYCMDVYAQIIQDVQKRYFSINALNIIKNARPRTFYHSFRVADLSVLIARKMGMDKKSLRNLCYAAIIHDIGELYVPRDVFYKVDKLTKEEFEIIKQHPKNLKNIFFHNPIMDEIIEIAYYHHERMDGKGYYGYKKEEIPMESRILALAETVDGLHTDRPGRKGFEVNQIIEIVKRSAIDIFDEDVVNNAIEIIDKFYGAREFELSMLQNINNIGKPVTIMISKNGKLMLYQGSIEYTSGQIIGVIFNDEIDIELFYNDIVTIQFPFLDIIYDFKASVISSTDISVNLLIKESSESMLSNLNVFWEFDAIAVPLRLSGKVLDTKPSNNQFVKIRTRRFGSMSLSAIALKSPIKLSIGDTVVLKMKPLNEIISIPAVISNVIDNEDETLVYFEYLSLTESTDARIHEAIFRKQSERNKV